MGVSRAGATARPVDAGATLSGVSSPDPIRRTRGDLCPGVLRPWPAADGALVRLRVPGGRVSPASLAALGEVARRFGDDDGDVHLTSRANLQLRALPQDSDGQLPAEVVAAIAGTGLLPSPGHELVRNILVSPLTGLDGPPARMDGPGTGLGAGTSPGRADLRPVTEALDAGLLADPALGTLPGRFLFVLDDGRGDLVDRSCDLGLVVLGSDSETGTGPGANPGSALAQLRIGEGWGEVVPLAEAAARLVALARAFADARGTGPEAPWHVRELLAQAEALPEPPSKTLAEAGSAAPAPTSRPDSPVAALTPTTAPDPRLPELTGTLPFGPVPGSAGRIEHVAAPGGVLTPALLERLTAPGVTELVVTPWRGVVAVHA